MYCLIQNAFLKSKWETDDNIPLKKMKSTNDLETCVNIHTLLKEPDSLCDWTTRDNIPLNELKCPSVYGSSVEIEVKGRNVTAIYMTKKAPRARAPCQIWRGCLVKSGLQKAAGDDEDEVKTPPLRKIME